MRQIFRLGSLVIVLFVVLTACGPAAAPPPSTESPAPTAAPPTVTAAPTITVAPTSSNTPVPRPTKKPGFKLLPLPPATIKDKVEVNGHKLYVACYGQGSPTIVLEHGFGTNTSTWNSIIPYLAPETQVCAYDRFNTGQSDVVLDLLTIDQVTADLHALVKVLKIEGPVITVGHSLGGPYAVAYALRYPEEVAGIVLVDSSYPEQDVRYLAAVPTPMAQEDAAITALREIFEANVSASAHSWELSNWSEVAARFKSATLGDRPLVALTQAKKPDANWPQLSPELADKLEEVWQEIQRDYVAMSSDGKVIVAQDSGHGIQWDQPQLVVDSILEVVKKVRQ
jgi:pimeloyl-ACP methyl ester carboxylesterase